MSDTVCVSAGAEKSPEHPRKSCDRLPNQPLPLLRLDFILTSTESSNLLDFKASAFHVVSSVISINDLFYKL